MAESSVTADSDMILPYRFEPDSLWSSSEESDSDDTDSQASFTERLATLPGALARNVYLCHMLLSAFVAASYQRL